MPDLNQLAILKRGVQYWNNNWMKYTFVPKLSGADLRGADLQGITFFQPDLDNSGAELDSIDLSGAKLKGADFRRAQLRDARFAGADLSQARFGGAKLDRADFTRATLFKTRFEPTSTMLAFELRLADLDGAVFVNTKLHRTLFHDVAFRDADFAESILDGAWFINVDFSGAKGLDAVTHKGPSAIDINTVYRSGGNIPDLFLRGCGVPDSLITFQRSLVGQPIQFYSCFISYSSSDEEFARRLHSDLQSHGVRCWFAPHDIRGGKKVYEQIDEAIRVYDRLLLILSQHSINSEWVKTEIAHARKKELKTGSRVLFPIGLVPFHTLQEWQCFDADTGKDSAREIREYFIPDFTRWKDHDAYYRSFQGLISDLRPNIRRSTVA